MNKSKLSRIVRFVAPVVAVATVGASSAFAGGGGSPTDAIVSALGDVQSQGSTVMASAGAIIIGLAVLGGLWRLGARWARRAASGG